MMKMVKLEELKKGDKIYSLVYWSGGKRELRTHIVKSVKRGRIHLYDVEWTLGNKEFNIDYFPSKLESYKEALTLHERAMEHHKANFDSVKKEVKYLQRKVKEEVNKMDKIICNKCKRKVSQKDIVEGEGCLLCLDDGGGYG